MRKLVIFLYFVFLFKLAFAQSLSLPKFNGFGNVEPAAGTESPQMAESAQVPALEDENGDELPADFDLPVSDAPKKDEGSSNAKPADTTATIDIQVPSLDVAEEVVSPAPAPVVDPNQPEVSDLPKLPDQNVDQAAAPAEANADADIEKELSDDSVRNQFPSTPELDYAKQKTAKQKTEEAASQELTPADREKEVDNLLNQVFDKEKTPEELAAEEEEKKKDAELAEQEKNAKQDDSHKMENLIDVADSPVKPIDALKTDDDEQVDLADLPASMKSEGKQQASPFATGAVASSNSYTYSEQQLSDLLVKASMRGDKQSVIQLIQSGRNVNAQNTYGESALMGAVYNNHNDIVEILLSEGADANTLDNKGNSSLIVASAKNNVQAVQTLIRSGADVDLANNSSDTALLVAALNGNVSIVDMLVRQGADINKPNADGLTALHIAAYNGNALMAKYLLSVGANPNAIARGGFRPYDLAKTKNPQLAQGLLAYSTNKQKISEARNIASEIKARNVAPAPQKANYGDQQYAMYPKAYVQQPAPQAEQLPQNDWWAAKAPEAAPVTPVAPVQKVAEAKIQPIAMPASQGGVQRADYSNYYSQDAAKPASLSQSAPVVESEKKWTKLTVDPNALKAEEQKAQALKQLELAKAETLAAQNKAAQAVAVQKASYENFTPVEVIKPAQTNINANNNFTPVAPQATPQQSFVANFAVAPQASAPVVRVRYDANGKVITSAPVAVNAIQPVAPAIVKEEVVKNNVFSAPASMSKPVALNNNVAPVQKAAPAFLAQEARTPATPVAVVAPQPQFYNQPISNNINLNIPRYADLDPSKQAVWDRKLEEWVMNGININAKDDTQRIFWMKQQAVLEKVYQEKFPAKVESIKRKIGGSAMNVTPAAKKFSTATVTSRPVKLTKNQVKQEVAPVQSFKTSLLEGSSEFNNSAFQN